MNQFYLKWEEGQFSYSADTIFESDQFLVLVESESKVFTHSLLELVYKNKHIPGKVQSMIDGLFTMVLFDKADKSIYLFQDKFSYISPLYYYVKPDSFVCSLSLNSLLMLTKETFELDYTVIPEFLYSGFICQSSTLLKDICKLQPLHQVKIINGVVDDIRFDPSINNNNLYTKYEEAFESAVLKCVDSRNPVASISLSGGYDSNFLLHVLKKYGYYVHTYTGGGVVGVDEIPVAKQICGLYNNIEHSSVIVDSNVLDIYPQIVLANEGALYERGIFLHYLMGKEFAKNNVERTISGDGADQILSENFRYAVTEFNNVGKVPHNPWETNPFEMLVYIALKKTGIFLRKHKIQPTFPFIEADFLDFSINRKLNNGTAKIEYIDELSKIISPKVYALLNRCGGSTNLKPIFKNRTTFMKYREIVENSKFYRYLPPQPDRYGYEENEYDTTLKILYLMLFEKMYTTPKSRDYIDGRIKCMSIDAVLEV